MARPRAPKPSPAPAPAPPHPIYSEATAATFRAALDSLTAKPDEHDAALAALFDEGRLDDAAEIERIFTTSGATR